MNFAMSMELPAAPEKIWEMLTDVASVSACIPGCEDVEELERLSSYKAVVKQKVGPFKVVVPADIAVTELDEPSRVRIRATGRDRITRSELAVDMSVLLSTVEQVSQVDVEATVEIQGRLASLGLGIINRRAEQLFVEFESRFKSLFLVEA